MRFLPAFFANIPDPRRCQGRRHSLPTVLAVAAGATLCGMRSYKAISDWAKSLGTKARERSGCRRANGHRVVPSEYVIRDVLVRVDPVALDRSLQRWSQTHGEADESLAIDGKTMCNAIDAQGRQTHIMSVVGHRTNRCYTQKKVGALPVGGDDKVKRTNEIKVAVPLLDAIDIRGKDITADALLTQRQFAAYLVENRQAHYHFIVKGNQPHLLADVAQQRQEPDCVPGPFLEHGRIETRKTWTTAALNHYLDFPHVGQAFLVERERIEKKSGKRIASVSMSCRLRRRLTPEWQGLLLPISTDPFGSRAQPPCHSG